MQHRPGKRAIAQEVSRGTLREFESEALVLLSGEFVTRELIDGYCRERGVVPRAAMGANSFGAVIELVRRALMV
jgi:LysR family cyn operon transcriptional activator